LDEPPPDVGGSAATSATAARADTSADVSGSVVRSASGARGRGEPRRRGNRELRALEGHLPAFTPGGVAYDAESHERQAEIRLKPKNRRNLHNYPRLRGMRFKRVDGSRLERLNTLESAQNDATAPQTPPRAPRRGVPSPMQISPMAVAFSQPPV
jgi:hypothetical protein